MIVRAKNFSSVVPYTYTLTRLSDGLQYHGVRWGNVRKSRAPENDLGKLYFSSGMFKKEYKKDPSKFGVRLRWTFSSINDAVMWESRVNAKIIHRTSWANIAVGKSNSDPIKMNSCREKSLMAKYGVRHNFLIPEVTQRIKENLRVKYGCDNPGQSPIIRSRVIETNVLKYGVEYTFQSTDVRTKIKASLLQKFGVDNPRKSVVVQEQMKRKCLSEFGVEHTFQRADVIGKIHHARHEMYIKLAKMSDGEFSDYLAGISPKKCVQNQKRSQRKIGTEILKGLAYG